MRKFCQCVDVNEKSTRYLSFFIVFILCVGMSYAQNVLTGKVTDVSGMPLIGASVTVNGYEEKGTITDMDGNYSLILPDNVFQFF